MQLGVNWVCTTPSNKNTGSWFRPPPDLFVLLKLCRHGVVLFRQGIHLWWCGGGRCEQLVGRNAGRQSRRTSGLWSANVRGFQRDHGYREIYRGNIYATLWTYSDSSCCGCFGQRRFNGALSYIFGSDRAPRLPRSWPRFVDRVPRYRVRFRRSPGPRSPSDRIRVDAGRRRFIVRGAVNWFLCRSNAS